MGRPVSLDALIEEVELSGDGRQAVFNTETGEATIWGDPDELVAMHGEDVLEGRDCDGPEWVAVPYPDTDSDWKMMRDFAFAQDIERFRDRLLGALHGRRCFSAFRQEAASLGLIDAWFAYREVALRALVTRWLAANGYPFVEREHAPRP